MKKRIVVYCVIGLVGLGIGGFVGKHYYHFAKCNFESMDGQEHGYYVHSSTTVDSLLLLIQQDYSMGSSLAWEIDMRLLHFQQPKEGYYRIPVTISNRALIRMLMMGQQSPIHLTWTNQVRNREQLASRLSAQLKLDSLTLICHLDSLPYMQQYGMDVENAVCLFLPNTYDVYWTISVDQLFARMKREYDLFWTAERKEKAHNLGLTPTEVSTLASIIESETNKKEEYPTIASLYLNRVRKGIPLQACPTVIFASGNLKLRRVLKRHLSIDSPYNTYKYAGLPPGPIRCAMGTTIDAVLNAPSTNYLFMCANPDWSGTHVFSSTYRQHAAVARAYQVELNKRKIR